jgi:hypothetical protein
MQIPVGIGTPSSVVETVIKKVDEFLRANKNEYTGNRLITLQQITESMPIRLIIFVAFQLSHSGEYLALAWDGQTQEDI